MAIIARFSFDVPFGKKADYLKLTKKWEPLSDELGFPKPEMAPFIVPGSHRWDILRIHEG